MPPDDGDPDQASEIPSFADLVERLKGAGTSSAPDGDAVEEGDDEPPSVGDLAEPTSEFDASKWQWGSESDEVETTSPSPSHPVSGPDVGLGTESKTEALLDLLDDASNVLVVGPGETPAEFDLCAKMGSVDHRPRRRLLVTTVQSPDERLNALGGYGAGSFDQTSVIAVGDQSRSSGNGEPSTTHLGGETVTIEAINDQRDLTRLGLLINKHLADGPGGPPAVVCFHTLSTILRFVEVEKAFRFLHVLQGRIRSAGARAHYHLDPDDHDDEVVHTLRPIFDFTVRFNANGDLTVDT